MGVALNGIAYFYIIRLNNEYDAVGVSRYRYYLYKSKYFNLRSNQQYIFLHLFIRAVKIPS